MPLSGISKCILVGKSGCRIEKSSGFALDKVTFFTYASKEKIGMKFYTIMVGIKIGRVDFNTIFFVEIISYETGGT